MNEGQTNSCATCDALSSELATLRAAIDQAVELGELRIEKRLVPDQPDSPEVAKARAKLDAEKVFSLRLERLFRLHRAIWATMPTYDVIAVGRDKDFNDHDAEKLPELAAYLRSRAVVGVPE